MATKMTEALEAQLTNDGRVPLPIGVTPEKLVAADKIIEGVRKGDAMAVAQFKAHMGARYGEVLTTGDDFIYAYAQLNAIQVDNEFQGHDRTWDQIVDVQPVSTFDAPKIYSIDSEVTGFARPVSEPGKPAWVPPRVPENSPYPEFKFAGELAAGGEIAKSGGQFGLSFERIVSDPVGLVSVLPTLINEFLLDREEYDVYAGMLAFIDGVDNHLKAGTTLDGTAVPADAPLGRGALDLAIQQLDTREIRGRQITVSAYTLLVPVGSERTAQWYLNTLELDSLQATNGGVTRNFALNNYNPLSKINKVVETEYLTGSAWALIPTKGSIRGNKKFFTLGRLIGHEGPELRVQNVTGTYVGGGAVPPFEGSFATDSAAFRGRIISGGLGWNSEYGLRSTGTGTPVVTP